MNILLVNWQDVEHPQAGGAEIHLFELFGRLAAAGHRVRLVCSAWAGAPPRAVVRGIEVHRHGDRLGFAWQGRGAVRAALRREPADVVVEDVNKVPLFLPLVTRLPFCTLVPHLFGTTAFAEVSWPMAAAVWLAERPLPRVYRRTWFHVISESTRDDLVARGVAAERIRVIHPGVDSARFTPAGDWRRAPVPSFLYVGRLKRYKGVQVALEAFARVRAARPDARFDVVGSGDYRAELEARARALGLGDAVTFHGYVDEATKLRFLREAWANVFPSPKEGWGITVMEAAACGTPSLASDSPGLRDSVRDGVTGHLVPHGDVAAMAARMLELAGDPARVEALGRAARRHAEAWSWDDAARATAAHLEAIVAGDARVAPAGSQ